MAHSLIGHPSVLVVDDEPAIRSVLERWLVATGYAVETAADADEALQRMSTSPAAVALCDVRLPGHDGLWLAERLRRQFPETAVIMATGVQEVGCAINSLRAGVIDYLTKPFARERLQQAVARGIEWHRAACEARRWQHELDGETSGRYRRIADAIVRLPIDSDATLDAILSIVTLRDADAYAHAYRVAALAAAIARLLHLDDAPIAILERAALVHDFGRMTLPDAILRKPAPLDREEEALVRRQPQLTYELLRDQPYLREAAPLVLAIRERYDGRGYPHGLSGQEIPLGARILAVAEAHDTMTRARVFREAVPPAEASVEIERCAGSHFDAAVVEAFRRAIVVH
jgi:response regulator RpfG family c-di-GMP phosphodiesterase